MAEWLNSLRLRLRSVLRPSALERDLHDEMAFHLANARGAASSVRRCQRRDNGPPPLRQQDAHGEELRDAWAVAPRLSSVVHDMRYAGRALLLAVWVPMSVELSGTGDAARIVGARVSAALFRVLGVSPLLGPRCGWSSCA